MRASEIVEQGDRHQVITGAAASVHHGPHRRAPRRGGRPRRRDAHGRTGRRSRLNRGGFLTLLRLEDLQVTYKLPGRGPLDAVDGVSFDIEPRQVLGLVGESGCGKSTLARAVCGLVPVSRGTISFNGRPVGTLGLRRRVPALMRIQMVFQNPFASLNPRRTIGSQIEDGLRVNPQRDAWTVGDLLEHVELEAANRTRFPHQFSGAQRQRVAIARAIAAGLLAAIPAVDGLGELPG